MRRRSIAFALLLAAGSAACSSRAPEPPPAPDAQPQVFDVRGDAKKEKPKADPAKCAHVWEQKGIHPYEAIENGIPMTEICVMTRCMKCGLVRHECGIGR